MAKPPVSSLTDFTIPTMKEALRAAPAFAEPTTPSGTATPVVPAVSAEMPSLQEAATVGPFMPTMPLGYDTAAGPGLGRARANPVLMGKAFAYTDKMAPAAQLQTREQIYTTYTGRPPPVTVKDITEAQDTKWWEHLVGQLEILDLPRRGLAFAGAGLAQAVLPDPGTPAGDALESLAGSVAAHVPITPFAGLNNTEKRPLMEEMGRNLYKAAATDDLITEWAKTPGYYYTSISNPTMEAVLDRVIPVELAARLEQTASHPMERAAYSALQTNLGRVVFGMVGEMATDPLLLAGPSSKASKVIEIGQDAFRVNSIGQSAAEALTRATGISVDEGLRTVVRSGLGGPEAQAAKDALLRAETEAIGRAAAATSRAADLRAAGPANVLAAHTQHLDEIERAYTALKAATEAKDAVAAKKLLSAEESLAAARLRVQQAAADPAQAGKMLNSQIEAYERTAATERALARNVRLTLDAADTDNLVRAPLLGAGKTFGSSGIVSKGAGPSGIVGGMVNVNEYSLPFSDTTFTLTASNFGLRPVMKLAAKAGEPYTLSNLQKIVDEGRVVGMSARDVLSPGQQLAYVAQKLGRPIDTTYRHLHDFIGRTLGTRLMQPMLAKLSTLTRPLDRSAGNMDNLFPLTKVIDGKWLELDKVAPELWQNYQSAVERYFAQTAASDQYLKRGMIGVLEQAQAVVKARKAAAKAGKIADPVLAKQYMDDAYGVQDIINEAADAIETGAGVLDPASKSRYRADLAAMLPAVQTLRANIMQTFGKTSEEVTQSLAAMARFIKGDEAFDGQIGQALAEIDAEVMRLTAKQGRAQAILQSTMPTVGVRSKWFGAAMDELDPARLGAALDRFLKASGQREVAPAMLRAAVTSLVNGDTAKANDILRRIAMAHGKSAPADGVNILAGMLSGRLTKRPNIAMLDAINQIIKETEEVARMSDLFRSGKMTTIQEADALMAMAKQMTRIEMAQARSLLGDDGFMKAMLMADALDEPNLIPALAKAIGRPEAQVAQGVANMLRARKGTKVMADVAKKSNAEFRKILSEIDVDLPPNITIEQWFDDADVILRDERIAQAVQNIGEQAAKDAVFQRLRLTALGYNNNGVLDAFTEQKFRDAANQIVDAAIRVKNVPTFPEDAALLSATDGLRVAEEELAAVRRALADLDAVPDTPPKYSKAEQKMLAEAEAKVAAARQAVEDAKAAAQAALDNALEELRKVKEAADKSAMARTTKKQRAVLTRDLAVKEQAVADARKGVNDAQNAASGARVQWQQMMSGYINRTTGSLKAAFQQFAQGTKEAKMAASAQRTVAETTARIAELEAQRAELAAYRSQQGLRTLETMPPSGVRMENVKPPPSTRVIYVPKAELDNIIATTPPQQVMTFQGAFTGNVFEVNGTAIPFSDAPTKDYALVAVAPNGDLSIEAVRTSGATKGILTEQVTDFMRYNPPVDYTGKLKYRELEQWERTLWSGFRQLTANMPQERVVEAAFLALRDASPAVPGNLKSALDKIEKVTPQRLTTRFGDVAPDIRPIVEEFSALLKSYETMYAAHGMDFAADPLRLMRDWGVTAYVPHIGSTVNQIAAGRFSSAVMAAGPGSVSKAAPSLDRALSTSMAQRHERRLGGTVAEIMAVAQDPTRALTLDPVSIISRYAQANGALAAQDFLLMGLRTGVIRALKAEPGLSVAQIAARDQMVPLFTRPSAVRDYDVLLGGTAQDWAGAGVDAAMLDQARVAIKEWAEGVTGGRKLKDISPFASWLGDIPVVQQAINIEQAVIDIRTMQFKAGQPLLDINAVYDDIVQQAVAAGAPLDAKAAWKATAVKVNQLAAQAGSEIRITGDHLMTWFDQGSKSWQLYVPATVAQSMIDTLDTTAYAERVLGDGGLPATLKKIGDAINRVYKPWYTITQMAHHVGNAIGNLFNNVLDLGVGGALNPKTNILSSQLSMAAGYVEQYGSLSKAQAALSAPRMATETDIDFYTRAMRHESFKALGLEKALLTGIDLGDGVVREADTAMRILREQGIHAGGHSTYLDMDRFEQDMAEVYALSTDPERWNKIKRTFYNTRDSIIFTLPMTFSGSLMGLGIVMPPRLGSMIAGFVETQARTANFIANMKRGGSIEQATQHVNRYLFNYNDLTAVQKTWMRTIFPFFTWTFKNTYLQASMALEKPFLLQLYGKMLVFDAPKIVDAYERDIEFKERFPAHPAKRYSLNWRLPHARYRLRIPVPELPTLYLEGFRTPLESAAENIGMIGAAGEGMRNAVMAALQQEPLDPKSTLSSRFRILSQAHFAARYLFETMMDHSLYYDRPLSQLDNAKPVGQSLTALNRVYTAGVPVLSPIAGQMHDSLVFLSGFGSVQRFNSSRGVYEDTPYASPGFVHTFMNMPYSQMLRTMMGASDVYQTSIGYGSPEPTGGRPLYRVPDWARYLDALSGIGLTQEDPLVRIRMVERDARDMQLRAMEEGGGVLTFDKPFIPKQ